ncbi:MAG TPA: AraC family transcriptional regulator [Chitinophagaceae bacterium]
MESYYDYVRAHPFECKQFSCGNLLFLIHECPPGFTKGEDWTEHNAFLYVIAGEHKLSSRERTWHLVPGTTVFVKKGGLVIERVDEEAFCALMFFIPDEFIRSFMRENRSLVPHAELSVDSGDKILPVRNTAVMHAFYESVLPYFSTNTQPHENLIQLKFRELLLNIITNPDNNGLTAHLCRLALTDKDDLLQVMEENCLFNLQLHEYARICHRSLSTFKRDFNESYGMSPGKWLLKKRMDAAARLLVNTEKPVADVVIESGFKNLAHFDRVFKEHFGSSPLQYRKQRSAVNATTA